LVLKLSLEQSGQLGTIVQGKPQLVVGIPQRLDESECVRLSPLKHHPIPYSGCKTKRIYQYLSIFINGLRENLPLMDIYHGYKKR